MHKQLSSLLLILGACAVCADEIPTLPQPRKQMLPRVQPFPLQDEDLPQLLPLAELRHYMQKLKTEREGLDEDRMKAAVFFQDAVTPESADIAKLRLRLGSLLTTLGTKKTTPAPSSPTPAHQKAEPMPPPIVDPSTTPSGDKDPPKSPSPDPAADVGKALDPLALAQALFRAGNYQGALQAYRLLPQDGLKAEERAPLQYMIATCLRKLGKADDATQLYREVANSRGDEHLASCAQWQLNLMRWQRDTSEQLARIRQRRMELEKQP